MRWSMATRIMAALVWGKDALSFDQRRSRPHRAKVRSAARCRPRARAKTVGRGWPRREIMGQRAPGPPTADVYEPTLLRTNGTLKCGGEGKPAGECPGSIPVRYRQSAGQKAVAYPMLRIARGDRLQILKRPG